MTPSVLTPQIEQVELVQEISNRPECKERILIKRNFIILILRFQSSAPVIHNESILTSSSSFPSTITLGPNMTKSVLLHLRCFILQQLLMMIILNISSKTSNYSGKDYLIKISNVVKIKI